MSDHDDIQHLDPDQLLTGFSRTPFLVAFLLSIFAHVIFLGLFSLTPLLDMVLPQVEPAAVVEEGAQSESSAESATTTSEQSPPSSTSAEAAVDPSASQPPAEPAPEPAALDGEGGTEESPADNTEDDFDIDLDVLNR